MLQLEPIRTRNDEGIALVTTGDHNGAIGVFSSALEQLHSAEDGDRTSLMEAMEAITIQDDDHEGPLLYPLPTSMRSSQMQSSSGADVFSEFFMLIRCGNPHTLLNDSFPADDVCLATTAVMFNMGLCHHLRSIDTTVEVAERMQEMGKARQLYELALDAGHGLLKRTCAHDEMSKHQQQQGIRSHNNSATWLIILSLANNLGCIAAESADYQKLQECLNMGTLALRYIQLPLFWKNGDKWSNPSPAA